MAENTENKYQYLWIRHNNHAGWDYYYYSLGITKQQAKEILTQETDVIDYELTNSKDNIADAIPM